MLLIERLPLLREISDVWSIQSKFEKIASKNGKTEIKAYRCHCFDLKEPFLESVIRRVQVETDIPVCEMRETIDNDTVVFMLTHSSIQGNWTKWMENHITQKSHALPLTLSLSPNLFYYVLACDVCVWQDGALMQIDAKIFTFPIDYFQRRFASVRRFLHDFAKYPKCNNNGDWRMWYWTRCRSLEKPWNEILGWLVQRFPLFPLICFIRFSSFHPIGLPPVFQSRALNVARFAFHERNCANNKCCVRWWLRG